MPGAYSHTISISFDTDHMDGGRMAEFLKKCGFPGTGTYFCTTPYAELAQTCCEKAPHPYLGKSADWLGELRNKRAEFPDAVGWRSHSCVFSHIIAEWLAFNNYAYASTHDEFGITGIRPSLNMWGLWQVPIYYMDNLDISRSRFLSSAADKYISKSIIKQALAVPGNYVFDFHPIHLLLNSPTPAYYDEMRPRFLRGEEVEKIRYQGRGVYTFFMDLIDSMEKRGFSSVSIQGALLDYAPDALHAKAKRESYVFEDWRINDIRC